MTVLAAAYDPETGEAAMAADSLMGAGPVACRSSPKILRCGDALIGIAGSPSFLRALRAYTPYEAGRDPRTWVEGLVDALVDFGNERGHGGVQGNLRFHNFDGLVVLRGCGIWTIGGEGDASPVIDPTFWASGSGGEIALGAMYAMRANGLAPIANSFSAGMVKRAAEAACSLVPSCSGPIQIEELPPLLGPVSGELALEEPPGEAAA